MKSRRLFLLPVLGFALSCSSDQSTTGPSAPGDGSKIISDGAHGGNRDFFFLPPMVPLAKASDGFELGKFNNALKPSLKIEICELAAVNLNAQGRPSATTPCIAGAPIKTFAPGSVNLVNLPRNSWGWWSLFNLPPDGFYYVLWNTRQSNLDVNKYYRIHVLIDGASEPLGVADVDPMSSLRQWQYSATGEVVQMVDDTYLPIAFRVEKGALCEGGTQCTSATVTNDNPNGDSQILQVTNETGEVIAGVLVPDGWLPADGPQSVVFTITRVNTGVNNVAAGTQSNPCHANLPLQQFDACFHYSTIPELEPIDESGRQFAVSIIAGVCFVLHDTDDPREEWVQLWSSEPDEEGDTPKPLRSADASAILTGEGGRDCGSQEVIIGSNSTNPLTRFAGLALHKLSRGAGRLFGVKTAYAVDLGIGGILDDISNIGPALTAEIREVTSSDPPSAAEPGTELTTSVRIVGTKVHDGDPLGDVLTGGKTQGIPGLPVTFSLFSSTGASVPFTGEGSPMLLTAVTDAAGFATVPWTPPTTADTYTLKVAGQAKGGPKTYTVVVMPFIGGLVDFGTPDIGESYRQVINPYIDAATGISFSADPLGELQGLVVVSRNASQGTSACVLPEDFTQKLGTTSAANPLGGFGTWPIRATFPTTVPAGTALSIEVQIGDGDGTRAVQLRFFDAAGAQVGSVSEIIPIGPDARCEGAPGPNRVRMTISTVAAQAFKHLVIAGPGGRVFVIDNLQIGTPPAID